MSDLGSLVLVVNSGSSSLKFTVRPADGGPALRCGQAECLGSADARLTVKSADGGKHVEALDRGDHTGALATIFLRDSKW